LSGIVGLLAGFVYVYAFILIFEEKSIPQNHKDLCISIVAMAYSSSVLVSSIFGYYYNMIMDE
jgi:hypothetical protein